MASLASTPAAAAAFAPIRDAWRRYARTPASVLQAQLDEFLAQYPNDGLAPLAHVYLAIVALRLDNYRKADEELAHGASLPPGSTRELWTVARARRLRMSGEPEAAMTLLRPLVGKNVDPVTRTQFEQELTLTALATSDEYEAISYMDAWLRASTDEEKPETVDAVTGMVARLPKDVLVGALQAMRTQRTRLGYGVDIERILAARLVTIATTNGDAQLARLLLDSDSGAIVVPAEAGAELGELATSRRGLNSVEGRTIGLLLMTDSPALRDESAAVLRGAMWALGLPPGVRRGGGVALAVDARAQETGYTCAAPEPAPLLPDPSPGEGLRLVTRDDAGSSGRTEVALDELVGEGAALVIAGLDAETSTRALRWGSNHGVAVIALAPPEAGEAVGAFGYVVGADRKASLEALLRAAPALAGGPVAPVVDASELADPPATFPDLRLLPPTSCDAPVVRAGAPRFPLASWQAQKVRAWVVSGSPSCAADLLGDLERFGGFSREPPTVALTLEAASLLTHTRGLRVVTASAGLIPSPSHAAADEVRRFARVLGDNEVTYWVSLGRDAATLARVAVHALPQGTVSEPQEVADRRRAAQSALSAAKARLWSTESTGWAEPAGAGAGHALPRTVCSVDLGTR